MNNKLAKMMFISIKMINKNLLVFILISIQIIFSAFVYLGIVQQIIALSRMSEIVDIIEDTSDTYLFTAYGIVTQEGNKEWKETIKCDDSIEDIGEDASTIYSINEESAGVVEYGHMLIDMLNPKMINGEWFNTYKKVDDMVPVVTSLSDKKVGETIRIKNGACDIKGVIIGIIDREQLIIDLFSSSQTNMDYSNLMNNCNYDYIFPYDTMQQIRDENNQEDKNSYENSIFIKISDKSKVSSLKKKYEKYGFLTDIDQLHSNYAKTVRDSFITQGISFIIFFLMSIIGLIGINSIISANNRKIYAIYFFLGLNKKECIVIEAVRAFGIVVVSFIIAILCMTVLRETFVGELLGAKRLNLLSLLLLFVYFVVIYLISSIGDVRKLYKTAIIDMYRKAY